MNVTHSRRPINLAITGASGVIYGIRLLELLLKQQQTVYLMISTAGLITLKIETQFNLPSHPQQIRTYFIQHFQCHPDQLHVFGQQQWTAPPASGSNPPAAMVICPCTSGTLGALAGGLSRSLIERSADVALKERRKLILVHRETPLSLINLENMIRLTQAGAILMPANPGFYHRPQTVEDIVDFMVARILDHLDIPHQLLARWGDNTVETHQETAYE